MILMSISCLTPLFSTYCSSQTTVAIHQFDLTSGQLNEHLTWGDISFDPVDQVSVHTAVEEDRYVYVLFRFVSHLRMRSSVYKFDRRSKKLKHLKFAAQNTFCSTIYKDGDTGYIYLTCDNNFIVQLDEPNGIVSRYGAPSGAPFTSVASLQNGTMLGLTLVGSLVGASEFFLFHTPRRPVKRIYPWVQMTIIFLSYVVAQIMVLVILAGM